MKFVSGLAVSLLLWICSTATSEAAFKTGHVFCDANLNNQLDAGDAPLPGVLVVVTSLSGTFSNAIPTAPDGSFSIELPAGADSYMDFVVSETLPAGTTLVTPIFNNFQISNDQQTVTNDFLVENLACVPNVPPGAFVSAGRVVCDLNRNGLVDTNDLPLQGVLVAITNSSGTFSNATFTGPDGGFLNVLTEAGDYGEYVISSTLPPQSVVEFPPGGVSLVTVGPGQPVDRSNFPVVSPSCQTTPPATNNQCWLTGSGTIRAGKKTLLHSFGGVVYPGCKVTVHRGGGWRHVDHVGKLQFKAITLTVVGCGNVPGSRPPKTPFNFIDFEGTGTLKGLGKNKTDYGMVNFYARAEDHGKSGKKGNVDRYYLRVTDATTGNVLLLVSTAPETPFVVAPVTISTGNLQLHTSSCNRR